MANQFGPCVRGPGLLARVVTGWFTSVSGDSAEKLTGAPHSDASYAPTYNCGHDSGPARAGFVGLVRLLEDGQKAGTSH